MYTAHKIDNANIPEYANKYDNRYMHNVFGKNGVVKTCTLKSVCATVHSVQKLYQKDP